MPQIFYSSVISAIINMVLKLLSLSEKKVLEIIGKVFEKENIEEKVIQSIKTTFDDKLKEFKEQIQIPTIHIIKLIAC